MGWPGHCRGCGTSRTVIRGSPAGTACWLRCGTGCWPREPQWCRRCTAWGVGKTQLAAEYAHRFAGSYELAWWVNAEHAGLIGDQVAALGLALGCIPPGAGADVVRAAVLAELRARDRWLLVFDNVGSPADVAPWLPRGGGHMLITSREQGWDELAAPGRAGLRSTLLHATPGKEGRPGDQSAWSRACRLPGRGLAPSPGHRRERERATR